MFGKTIALFAFVAVALAAPKPEPAPQVYGYASGVDYFSPYSYPAYEGLAVSPYAAVAPSVPLAYSAYPGAYSAYPGAYYVRK